MDSVDWRWDAAANVYTTETFYTDPPTPSVVPAASSQSGISEFLFWPSLCLFFFVIGAVGTASWTYMKGVNQSPKAEPKSAPKPPKEAKLRATINAMNLDKDNMILQIQNLEKDVYQHEGDTWAKGRLLQNCKNELERHIDLIDNLERDISGLRRDHERKADAREKAHREAADRSAKIIKSQYREIARLKESLEARNRQFWDQSWRIKHVDDTARAHEAAEKAQWDKIAALERKSQVKNDKILTLERQLQTLEQKLSSVPSSHSQTGQAESKSQRQHTSNQTSRPKAHILRKMRAKRVKLERSMNRMLTFFANSHQEVKDLATHGCNHSAYPEKSARCDQLTQTVESEPCNHSTFEKSAYCDRGAQTMDSGPCEPSSFEKSAQRDQAVQTKLSDPCDHSECEKNLAEKDRIIRDCDKSVEGWKKRVKEMTGHTCDHSECRKALEDRDQKLKMLDEHQCDHSQCGPAQQAQNPSSGMDVDELEAPSHADAPSDQADVMNLDSPQQIVIDRLELENERLRKENAGLNSSIRELQAQHNNLQLLLSSNDHEINRLRQAASQSSTSEQSWKNELIEKMKQVSAQEYELEKREQDLEAKEKALTSNKPAAGPSSNAAATGLMASGPAVKKLEGDLKKARDEIKMGKRIAKQYKDNYIHIDTVMHEKDPKAAEELRSAATVRQELSAKIEKLQEKLDEWENSKPQTTDAKAIMVLPTASTPGSAPAVQEHPAASPLAPTSSSAPTAPSAPAQTVTLPDAPSSSSSAPTAPQAPVQPPQNAPPPSSTPPASVPTPAPVLGTRKRDSEDEDEPSDSEINKKTKTQ